MGKPRPTFTREFIIRAIKLDTEQKPSFAEAAANVGVAENLLRKWKRDRAQAAEFGLGLSVSGRV